MKRLSSHDGAAWYGTSESRFGIEASEVADALPGEASTERLFCRLRGQLTGDVSVCASPPARCLAGESDGQRVVLWGHDEGPIAYVALAPDERHLSALLEAWRARPQMPGQVDEERRAELVTALREQAAGTADAAGSGFADVMWRYRHQHAPLDLSEPWNALCETFQALLSGAKAWAQGDIPLDVAYPVSEIMTTALQLAAIEDDASVRQSLVGFAWRVA